MLCSWSIPVILHDFCVSIMFPHTTKSALTCRADFHIHIFFRGVPNGGGQPLHRNCCASLHSDGGAFYSVTCSQRKYHYPRRYVVACGLAGAVCGNSVPRSRLLLLRQTILAHPPLGSTPAERDWQPYSLFSIGDLPAGTRNRICALLPKDLQLFLQALIVRQTAWIKTKNDAQHQR